uniref:Uncharacterized protein n=1 Tax=Zea mays TaxID=4577 RepID=A0A804PVF5_MAIZE
CFWYGPYYDFFEQLVTLSVSQPHLSRSCFLPVPNFGHYIFIRTGLRKHLSTTEIVEKIVFARILFSDHSSINNKGCGGHITLVSLIHDQCLKHANHRLSACFLGSGQPDSRVEAKAIAGMYKIVYVCHETILRLMDSLKKLAKKLGIALFAIDEEW